MLFIFKPAACCMHVCVSNSFSVCVPYIHEHIQEMCVASEGPIATRCTDTAPGATGCTWRARAVHQLLTLECQMHTHTCSRPTYACNCIFVSLHMRTRPCIDTCSFMSFMAYDAWMYIPMLTRVTINSAQHKYFL